MFLILWNVLGLILLISSLVLLFSLLLEIKPKQVKHLFGRRKSSHEERRYS
jgi:membrane-anchored glycerophosphoryl diester phosphodiesterase (GDPDase)